MAVGTGDDKDLYTTYLGTEVARMNTIPAADTLPDEVPVIYPRQMGTGTTRGVQTVGKSLDKLDAPNNRISASALNNTTTTVDMSGSSAPTQGQVMTATSSTTAQWETLPNPSIRQFIFSDGSTPSDYTDLNAAITTARLAGGGIVFIRNGTYNLTTDIIVPSNVTIQGETGTGVILDFNNTANQFIISGTLINSTGTVAISNNSSTVTGTGTTFSTNMIGSSILLKGRWFTIDAVASATSLTIDGTFDVASITGQSNFIAETVNGVSLIDFTVQNSTHANGAVLFKYTANLTFDNVTIFSSTIGLNIQYSSFMNIKNYLISDCGTGLNTLNCGVGTFYNFEIYGSTVVNLVANSFYSNSCANGVLSSATGNNATLTSCENWGFYDFDISSGGSNGIELISCSEMELFAQSVHDSVGDGIKLTSNNLKIFIQNIAFTANGGYGVNLPNSNNINSTIAACSFTSNTSGNVNDLGTSTIITTVENFTATVSTSGYRGDYTDIQTAINAVSSHGGGTVFIRSGTYVTGNDLVVPTAVKLEGESFGGVTIVFTGAYSIKAVGTSAYSTGTIAVTKGSTTVTGSGTSWLANVTTSHKIKINGLPYTIASVDTNTKITLSSKFFGTTASGLSYLTAIFVERVALENLVVIAAAGSTGIVYTYTDLMIINDTVVSGPSINGLTVTDSARLITDTLIIDAAGAVGISATRNDLWTATRTLCSNCTSHGFLLSNCTGTIFTGCPSNANGGDGYNVTDGTQTGWLFCEGDDNTASGLSIQGTATNCVISSGSFNNNVDGIKLAGTATNTVITEAIITNNSGYGVNVSAAGVATSLITNNQFSNNTSGHINDTGTNTLKALNNPSTLAGNIPVSNLNSGTSASNTTFWRGDGTWAAPASGATSASNTYTGNGGTNTAIAHGLGATPKFVFIYNFTNGFDAYQILGGAPTKLRQEQTATIQTVTTLDATNFYVSGSANTNTSVYYWFAIT